MQSLLVSILLTGGFSLLTCELYEYKYIEERKNWTEAQKFCRGERMDLATVYDMTDIGKLNDSADNALVDSWIGLSKEVDKEVRWHWSLPGVEFNNTDVSNPTQDCVVIGQDKKYKTKPCDKDYKFFCYEEKYKNSTHINRELNWTEAQRYCREKHTDLVSGDDQLGKLESLSGNYQHAWIGLSRDYWYWSDGSDFSFRHWSQSRKCGDGGPFCAFISASGEWNCAECRDEKPFFCYQNNMELHEENETWQGALDYCRDNDKDLVSILDLRDQRWVQEQAKKATTPYIWLGLRYTCTLGFYFWVSGDNLDYVDFHVEVDEHERCRTAVAMETGNRHMWIHRPDNEEYNFICANQF